ncbi:MAG: Crp/Fnr family transcriptional regulator [Usitatibacter sp.]
MLPRKERERMVASCDRVELTFAEQLSEPGGAVDHVHFPIGGFVSILTSVPNGGQLEVALVGNEGMVGIPIVMGVGVSQAHAQVQGAGPALRMGAARLRREMDASGALRKTMGNYLYARFGQLARAAGCNRFHVVESRLARWLLMTSDRAHSENFHITHGFLASMLGVRRVGVTTAASALKRMKLIRYQRGYLEILDRAGLEKVACGCYRADLENYRRVLASG